MKVNDALFMIPYSRFKESVSLYKYNSVVHDFEKDKIMFVIKIVMRARACVCEDNPQHITLYRLPRKLPMDWSGH